MTTTPSTIPAPPEGPDTEPECPGCADTDAGCPDCGRCDECCDLRDLYAAPIYGAEVGL
jgi:hypothetical protein